MEMFDGDSNQARVRQPGGDTSGLSRRRLLARTGVGAAAVWAAPIVVSQLAPVASASGAPVSFVAGSAATGYDTASLSTRTITLTSANLQAGDVWIAIVAYDTRGNINIPSGLTVVGPNDAATTSGGETNYTVRSYVVYRKLLASDLSGGTFSRTFTSTTSDLLHGGLRGAAVAYRAPNAQVVGAVTQANGNGPTNGSNIVTSAFPAASGAPLPAGRTIVRLGAARGYGGCNALSSDIDWQSLPVTNRVDWSTGNEGDRALVIAEDVGGTGASVNGTWYRQASPLLCTPIANWTAFTVVLRDV